MLHHIERNTRQLGRCGGRFCLFISSSLNLPFSCPDSAAVFDSTHLCPNPILPFCLNLWCRRFLWQALQLRNMLALHMFPFFLWGGLEVCGIRLKDRFLTHGGLALWSRKHKWCGCLSVPLCCCSLPPLYSSLHCTLCPCHSLASSLLPFAERLEPEASVTVSMGIDFSDSTQAANFQLW